MRHDASRGLAAVVRKAACWAVSAPGNTITPFCAGAVRSARVACRRPGSAEEPQRDGRRTAADRGPGREDILPDLGATSARAAEDTSRDRMPEAAMKSPAYQASASLHLDLKGP